MAMIKKKVMGKPMKAQKGKMISESGDLADALNKYEADKKKGSLPKTDKGAGKYMDSLNKQGKLGPKKPMKMGGTVKKAQLGMKSVKAGYDNNKGVTRADFVSIGEGEAKKGAAMKKCKYGCK
jgi:hypothetical protein